MLKVMFIGFLGQDAEEKYTQAGKRLVQFSVAVNERRPVQGSDEWADHTNWFRVRVSGRQCDYAQTLNKGNRVHVVGNLSVDAYTARDNSPRASLDVFADEITNLTPREREGGEQGWSERNERPAASGTQQREPVSAGAGPTELEDLPF